MEAKKKILIVIGKLGSGGAERNASILANELCRRGHDVTIAHVLESPVFYNFDSGVKIIDLSTGNKNFIKIGKRIKKLQNKEYFDTIISFFFIIGAITQLFCSGKKVKKICRETGDPHNRDRNKVLYKLFELILTNTDTIVFQNAYQKSCYSKKLQSKSIVINNPITCQEECLGWNPNSTTFISIGRLDVVKDFETMIRAFSLFSKEHHGFSLDIFGEGKEKEHLISLTKELGVSDSVHFCGLTKDVFSKIENARLYLHSSLYEGMPNSLLEAFLFGIPVISSNWSGYDTFLIDQQNCLIFEKQNYIEMAAKMAYLIDNKDVCLKITANAKSQRNSYDIQTIIDQWERLL